MKLDEAIQAISNIERVLHEYSAYFVDWERLYNEPGYRPDFPPQLVKAEKDIKLIAAKLGEGFAK